jgi:arsenate reductase-like glutaredoxin family protein
MNKSKQTSSPTKNSAVLANFIPLLAANPTVEELDEWVIAMGGRELTPEEAQEWNRKVHWTPVPGEKMPLGA